MAAAVQSTHVSPPSSAPRVAGIHAIGATRTAATTVRWTVTFTQSVVGVVTTDFRLRVSGITGPVAITSLSGSGKTRTVTATTGTSTPSGTGTLQLVLETGRGIRTATKIALAGAPVVGATYTITHANTSQTRPGLPFSMSGTTQSALAPGATVPVAVTLTNPNDVPITVTAISVAITGTSDAAACPAQGNFAITQQLTVPVTVPANASSVTLAALGIPSSEWPQLTMIDTGVSQDACHGVVLSLDLSGTAHS